MKVDPIVPELCRLRNTKMFNYIMGDYKAYKKSAKEFAKLAVAHPDEFKRLGERPMPKVTVPLFSKPAMRMLKVWFLEKFRIKTPEEKELKKIAQKNFFKKQFINNSMPKTKDNSLEHVG